MPSLDDARSKLDALEQRPPTGVMGWSASEILQHCAQSVEMSIQGFPTMRSIIVRGLFGPMVKRKFLKAGAMKHDLTAPIPGAPPLDREVPLAEALKRLRASFDAFQGYRGELSPHFAYGAVSHDEYAQLHAMHVLEHLQALGL
ncbi:MAG: DUF1569 domain-containing protein [Deltaproteobacteria bacterium]|nr:DUF1569 domain-containing protein [Deltaproteobacteria bacterium]